MDIFHDQAGNYRSLLNLLPRQEQTKKAMQDVIALSISKYGAKYVRQNILDINNNHFKNSTGYYSRLVQALRQNSGSSKLI